MEQEKPFAQGIKLPNGTRLGEEPDVENGPALREGGRTLGDELAGGVGDAWGGARRGGPVVPAPPLDTDFKTNV